MPNKVFDYIQAETPIIGTNLIEISKILSEYGVGEIIEEFTPENLALLINSIFSSESKLANLKANCSKARKVLNWESEIEILKEIYSSID